MENMVFLSEAVAGMKLVVVVRGAGYLRKVSSAWLTWSV
jgi:hypothetical protein